MFNGLLACSACYWPVPGFFRLLLACSLVVPLVTDLFLGCSACFWLVRLFRVLADDTTLICSSKQELLDLLKQTKEASEKRGLLLNTRKTKIMVFDKNRTDFSDFLLEDEKIEEVEEFTYLGSIIDTKCSSAKEIKRRIAMAKSTVHNLTTIWKSRGVSIGLKIRLLKSTAFAIALYGCESWAPTEADRKKINAFEMWCYRKLLRVSWTEKRTNEWILDKIAYKSNLSIGHRETHKSSNFTLISQWCCRILVT